MSKIFGMFARDPETVRRRTIELIEGKWHEVITSSGVRAPRRLRPYELKSYGLSEADLKRAL